MNELETTNTEETKKERWEFTKEIGKLTVRKSVEKIDGGYLLTTNAYGRKEGSDEYIDKTSKSFHKNNPLKEMIEESTEDSSKEEAKSSTDSAFNPFDVSNYLK